MFRLSRERVIPGISLLQLMQCIEAAAGFAAGAAERMYQAYSARVFTNG
jgi:hypothetical protein